MKPRTKFVLLSFLGGGAAFFLAALAPTAILVMRPGGGAHGLGALFYLVLPFVYGPIGSVAGLAIGLKSERAKSVARGLAVVFALVTVALGALLFLG